MFRKRFFGHHLGLFHRQTTRCTLCLRPTEQEVIPPEQLVQGHYVCTTCQQALSPKEIVESLQALGLIPLPPVTPVFRFDIMSLMQATLIFYIRYGELNDWREQATIRDTNIFQMTALETQYNDGLFLTFDLLLSLRYDRNGALIIDNHTLATFTDHNYFRVVVENTENTGKTVLLDMNEGITIPQHEAVGLILQPRSVIVTGPDMAFDELSLVGHTLFINNIDTGKRINQFIFMDRYGSNNDDYSNVNRLNIGVSDLTLLRVKITQSMPVRQIAPAHGVIHFKTEFLEHPIPPVITAIVAYNEYTS